MINRTIILSVIALLLAIMFGCQTGNQDPTPIFVTEIFVFDDGQEIVVTWEVTATPDVAEPTPQPTIPIPDSIVQLDIATTSRLGELDPQISHNDLTATVINNVYVGLTRVDAEADQLVNELALAFNSAESGRIWTIDLRDDLYWVQALAPTGRGLGIGNTQVDPLVEVQKVRPITAHDVVAAVQRICDQRIETPDRFVFFVIEGCEAIFELAEPDTDAFAALGVRAVSDTKLEVRLTQAAAYFPSLTALPAFRPIPPENVTSDEIEWLEPENLLTSGPFIFSQLSDPEADPFPITVLQHNPFWPESLTRPSDKDQFELIERINFYRYANLGLANLDYEKDLLDIVSPSAEDLPELVQSPAKPPPIITQNEVFYLGFNFDSPAFGLPEVRRAFSASIDRTVLIEQIYGHEGLPLRHFAPIGTLYAPPLDEVGTGYNPDYAFFQLANSGYNACRAIGEIHYLINATDAALRHAEALIQMWVDELGCLTTQFKIEQVQFGTLLARTNPSAVGNRPDIFDLGWVSFYPDAYNWYADVIHCQRGTNRPNRPCSEIDRLIDQSATTLNVQARKALYRDIENRLFNQNGWVPLTPLYLRGTYQLEQDWISRIGDNAESNQLIRFATPRFDFWVVNQLLKDLERSQ